MQHGLATIGHTNGLATALVRSGRAADGCGHLLHTREGPHMHLNMPEHRQEVLCVDPRLCCFGPLPPAACRWTGVCLLLCSPSQLDVAKERTGCQQQQLQCMPVTNQDTCGNAGYQTEQCLRQPTCPSPCPRRKPPPLYSHILHHSPPPSSPAGRRPPASPGPP